MNNETLRTVISTILSFMMMVCLALLALLISLYFTFFRVNFITDRMNDKYIDSVMVSLTKQLQDEIAPPSGFPDEVFGNLFSRSTIEMDSEKSVQAILANLNYTLDTTPLHNTLLERFTEYAKQNNLPLTDANLESLSQICIDEYERQITVPFLKSFASIRLTFENYFPYALLGLSAFLIITTVFLFKLHRFKHRALRFCIYTLFASALMLIPVPLWVLIQNTYAKINISPEHMRLLFVSAIRSTLLTITVYGLVLAVLACVCLPLAQHMRNQLIMQTRESKLYKR